MDKSDSLYSLKDSLVAFQTSQGLDLRATPLRLSRHHLVFEVYTPNLVLRLSEVLNEFRIIINDRTVYSGRAVTSSVINAGTLLVCEATLEDGWLDVDFSLPGEAKSRFREQFDEFFRNWQNLYRILPEYKVVIADLQSFLMDLRLWADQVELGIRSSPSADSLQLEREIIQEMSPAIISAINFFFEKFEVMAQRVSPELLSVHAAFMKRQLHPYVLCSPFAYRTFAKPLGYAGDYEMVNMISRSPYEGGSLFAKFVNLWFIQQPPAEAHRQRLEILVQRQLEETVRVAAQGRPARIFSLGCGPAIEVQRFLIEHHLSEQAQFTLLDFNEETIQHLTAAFSAIKTKLGRAGSIHLVKKSVQQLIKESGKATERPTDQQYDFVYCAGLFDYLPDQICQRLSTLLYHWLAPGGLLLATNVAPQNPLRQGMAHLLDWNLIYRNGEQLLALKPKDAPHSDASVKSDTTGINLFLEVRKPRDA